VISVQTQLRAERRPVQNLYRDLKVFYDGVSESVDVRSPDLTAEGMFLNTRREFRAGARLSLRFELLRTSVLVQTMFRVQYYVPEVGVAVKFVNLPAYARAAIEKELEELQK
jgi:PilZ domain